MKTFSRLFFRAEKKYSLLKNAAFLSVSLNSVLIAMKLVVGFMAMSIISEAIRSSMELAAAVIAFFAIRFRNYGK